METLDLENTDVIIANATPRLKAGNKPGWARPHLYLSPVQNFFGVFGPGLGPKNVDLSPTRT